MFLLRGAHLPQVALFINNKASLLLLALGFGTCQAISRKFIELYLFLLFLFSQQLASDSHHSTYSVNFHVHFMILNHVICFFSLPSLLLFNLWYILLTICGFEFWITVHNVFHRFHHPHLLKLFLKTDGFSNKTATSNNCYYLFLFYQKSTWILNDLPQI